MEILSVPKPLEVLILPIASLIFLTSMVLKLKHFLQGSHYSLLKVGD